MMYEHQFMSSQWLGKRQASLLETDYLECFEDYYWSMYGYYGIIMYGPWHYQESDYIE